MKDFFLGGGGGKSILKHIYLNFYAEFNSKVSYVMFLHDHQLAYRISAVWTLALTISYN